MRTLDNTPQPMNTREQSPAGLPSRPRTVLTGLFGLSLAAMVVLCSACDDTFIDPFDNDGRYYSVYGFLDETNNYQTGGQHVLRVVAVTRFPERITSPLDDQAYLDATVTTTDVGTGETVTWTHNLEQLSDGTYAHIFRSGFFVRAAHTYRLEVRRSDGIVASAETTVPSSGRIGLTLDPPRVDPDSGVVLQDAVLSALPSPWNIQVVYHVGFGPRTTPYRIPYGRVGTPTGDGGWRFTIQVSRDLDSLSTVLNQPANTIRFQGMGLNIHLLDGQWTPPEGVFDPEALAQPDALSNVENGYGFWGSIGLYQHDWTIDDALRDLLGF